MSKLGSGPRTWCRALAVTVALLGSARAARAQAWFYPSFQTPETVEREYNFAAVAYSGADFLFQWREGIVPGSQFSIDLGLADPKGASNTRLLIGGNYARELTRATVDQPIDLAATAGIGIAAGDGPGLVRIPVGVSAGHTFPLEGGMAITPYVHPRVSLDTWTGSREGRHNYLSLDFDLGASLALTPEMALRASVTFSGNDATSGTGVGISLAINPPGLRRR
jgi:hypothetical protein